MWFVYPVNATMGGRVPRESLKLRMEKQKREMALETAFWRSPLPRTGGLTATKKKWPGPFDGDGGDAVETSSARECVFVLIKKYRNRKYGRK
jgi:hypothetical protein